MRQNFYHSVICLVIVTLAATALAPRVAVAQCDLDTLGVGIESLDYSVPAFLGKSMGQTFLATGTRIASISVWRGQPPTHAIHKMKLWVTKTDSSGWPLIWEVLQEGPTTYVFGDTVTRAPVEVSYSFDPPLELPDVGLYAFFVQDPCWLGFEILLHQASDLYPDGRFWRTPRTNISGCGLDAPFFYSPEEDHADLIFEVVYCSDDVSPARETTWGRLKAIYR